MCMCVRAYNASIHFTSQVQNRVSSTCMDNQQTHSFTTCLDHVYELSTLKVIQSKLPSERNSYIYLVVQVLEIEIK